jgi:hypothetical protein
MWMRGRHLHLDASRSTLQHPVLGRRRGRSAVARPFARSSTSPGLLHSSPSHDIAVRDPQRNDLVRSEPRLPIALGDDQLHSLDPLLPCGAVPVTHTDETLSVLPDEMLRAFPARLEMEADRCGDGGGRVPARRDAAGGAPGRLVPSSRGTSTRMCPRRIVTASGTRSEPPLEPLPCARPASLNQNGNAAGPLSQRAGFETPPWHAYALTSPPSSSPTSRGRGSPP